MTPPASLPLKSTAPKRFWPVVGIVSLAGNAVLAWALFSAEPGIGASAPGAAEPAVKPASPNPEVAAYAALGSFMAESNRIADLRWTEPQFRAFQDGFRASYEGRGLPLGEDARRLRDETSARVQAMLAAEQPDPVQNYFRALREKEGVSQTASGLHYRITEPGTGDRPRADQQVTLSFSARLPDGTALPAFGRQRTKMLVRDLLPGLAEGIQLMNGGGKALLYLPASLSFSQDWPESIPPGTPLIFFVELHDVSSGGSDAK